MKVEADAATSNAWVEVGHPPALAPGEVHVWRLKLHPDTAETALSRALLSSDEIGRADRLRVEGKRAQFILARAGLRRVLASYLQVHPASLQFDYGPQGKPALAAPYGTSGIHFNLSHTEGWGLLGVTRLGPVGVDIEAIRPDRGDAKLADRFFSPREASALRAVPESERTDAFFRCWTCKEAYLKARGDGMHFPLHEFEVSLPPSPPALLEVRGAPGEAAAWKLRSFTVAPGTAAAVAIRASAPLFLCFDVATALPR